MQKTNDKSCDCGPYKVCRMCRNINIPAGFAGGKPNCRCRVSEWCPECVAPIIYRDPIDFSDLQIDEICRQIINETLEAKISDVETNDVKDYVFKCAKAAFKAALGLISK